VCYALSVDDPSPRPAAHWDASFEEVLSDGDGGHDWALHIGDSFGDVPRSSSFYSAVETLLHHQVTGGCGAGNYCPQQLNSRALRSLRCPTTRSPQAAAPAPAARASATHVPSPPSSRSSPWKFPVTTHPPVSPARSAAATCPRPDPPARGSKSWPGGRWWQAA